MEKKISFHLTWEARRERRISQIPRKKQTMGGTMSRKVASQFSNKDKEMRDKERESKELNQEYLST